MFTSQPNSLIEGVCIPVAIAQILPIMQNTDDLPDDNGLLFELDGDDTRFNGILKKNDSNACRYYLSNAVDQYLFTYSIFSFESTVFIL